LFGLLPEKQVIIYVDGGAYAIARWGVERAAARGTSVREFAHYDADALRLLIERDADRRAKPVVIVDGFCPACGFPAPLAAYHDLVRPLGGFVILDDTQALGILGERPGPRAPFGLGGGGTSGHVAVRGRAILVVASLAKAFGAPLAVLAGDETAIRSFEARSETRVHCSPPSAAALHAAANALAWNRVGGDTHRLRLSSLVRRFRDPLLNAGLTVSRGLFPAQVFAPPPGFDPDALHARLASAGFQSVLQRGCRGRDVRIGVLISLSHESRDVDRFAAAILRATGLRQGRSLPATRPKFAS
jgi:8-amino-7-oxononanoate synthase